MGSWGVWREILRTQVGGLAVDGTVIERFLLGYDLQTGTHFYLA